MTSSCTDAARPLSSSAAAALSSAPAAPDWVDLLHVVHAGCDLFDALPLLLRRTGDARHETVDVARPRRRLPRRPSTTLSRSSMPRRLFAIDSSMRPDVSRAAWAARWASDTHLVGHDREAHAGFAGPRRFDRRVEGEDVGLERDLVDALDDLRDVHAGFRDLVHGGAERLHVAVTPVGRRPGLAGQRLRRLRVLGVLPRHARHLFQGRASLFERCGLRRGALRDRLAGAGHLASCRRRDCAGAPERRRPRAAVRR